ncbi:MAG: phytanoyl-CoA dioxygenase family protein [Pseudomonadota bacterium]
MTIAVSGGNWLFPEPDSEVNVLSDIQQQSWHDNGYFLIRSFVPPQIGQDMLQRVVDISRNAARKQPTAGAEGVLVTPEQNLRRQGEAQANSADRAELQVSKIFRLHRDKVFRKFIESPAILEIGRSLLQSELDCFLSQFIFKNPGAWGQPWHQDGYYFPFDRSPQVGLWLAVTEATIDNGCLWVLPGSHRDVIHQHVPDRRPNANIGYVEIVDQDFSSAVAVTMAPGDLLVFHSHLMHRSKDNLSDNLRAAMVYHIASHGTLDQSEQPTPVNDWMPLPVR